MTNDEGEVAQLRQELRLALTALQRLALLLEQRRLLSVLELEAVRELLPPVPLAPITDEASAAEPRSPATASPSARRPAAARAQGKPTARKAGVTRSDRQAIGRLGAHSKWAQTEDRSAATQPARDALMRKFEDEVDPDRKLPADERAKRAESARRAYYQRLSLKAAAARRAKKKGS